MANQQAFQQYGHTNKGTLQPGQTISVNRYDVQVERYLSQGGFAHVYLVRTPAPVYNTTHHVLKRIAVANDAMLTEVKKEVDIMRILKGHPNIVHLIDAAWHRMPNGMYEVFILMEFCAGGGIIDMMNRRLRERLTESEILQIFVDVCEGVAAMHNLRPALLHRDLKVENILQSSPTSYKLCDFGSATPVSPKPPSSTAEIRALEADLNRHTTLQYRAPEMVDVYSRRPVDEKSDVWALGVLLYKLCYYTTPFEEHGPLAILNVQYKTPPYPVYSSQMNQLIASMLKEHGAQRPSIFEILQHVHRLRGTKSRFSYTIPTPQPLSPRTAQSTSGPSSNQVLSELVSFRASAQTSNANASLSNRNVNAGVQAREKVLEAIAPMRRGRPTSTSTHDSKSRQSSPQKENTQARIQTWLDEGFAADGAKRTQGIVSPVRGHRSGAAAIMTDAWKPRNPAPLAIDDAWNVDGKKPKLISGGGFDNDFSEKLWDSFEPGKDISKPLAIPSRPNLVGAEPSSSVKSSLPRKGQDAFEGLGLSPADRPQPQTLGEAKKNRTGLAVINGQKSGVSPTPSTQASRPSSSHASRPTPSPRPPVSPTPQPAPSSSWKPSPALMPRPTPMDGDTTPEMRFPSLEELDATFVSPPLSGAPAHLPSQPQLQTEKDLNSPPLLRRSRMNSSASGGLRPVGQQSYLKDGVRSEQVTGIAMREPKGPKGEGVKPNPPANLIDVGGNNTQTKRTFTRPLRPSLARKHRSSISIKHPHQSGSGDVLGSPVAASPAEMANKRFPDPKDWLTGDDDGPSSPTAKPQVTSVDGPVLREFNKRASYHESTPAEVPTLPASVSAEQLPSLSSPSPTKLRSSSRTRQLSSAQNTSPKDPLFRPKQDSKISSSSDEGPEDASGGYASAKGPKRSASKRRKGRQSSVNDLVDLWGGGVVHLKEKEKELSRTPGAMGDLKSSVSEQWKPPPGRRSPIIGDYKSSTSESWKPPLSRRSSFLPHSSSNTTSSTTQPLPTSPARTSRPQRSPSYHRKDSSAAAVSSPSSAQSPTGGHGRPRSMFIFPVNNSKSDSSANVLSSPNLTPPEDPAPRRTRRTSISDMVQRYESINGSSPVPKGPGSNSRRSISPSPMVQKPTALKVGMVGMQNTSSSTNNATRALRISQSSPTTVRPTATSRAGSSFTTSVRDDGPTGAAKSQELPSTSFTSNRVAGDDGPPGGVKLPGLPSTSYTNNRESIWTREVENPNAGGEFRRPPSRKTQTPDSEAPADRQPSKFSFPTRLSTPPPASQQQDESQSPSSPDRPYQGVGKLIDQWQRKTAEPERTTSLRRSGLVAKRALPGLVGGAGTGRGR